MTVDPANLPVDGISVRAIAALQDDTRRALYGYLRSTHQPIGREQAAALLGISRKLAGFHLDKLEEAGLVSGGYDPAHRSRTLGRTPKTYRPTELDINVTIPTRQPGLLAEMLVEALTTTRPDESPRRAAERVAAERGRQLGEAAYSAARPARLGRERALSLAETLLRTHGYEPTREFPTAVRLRNCPFHPLAAKAPDLVCQLNHRMLTGLLDGLQANAIHAVLTPRSGECCVELHAVK